MLQTIRYKHEVLALIHKTEDAPAELIMRVYPSINSAKRLNRGDVDYTCKTEKEFIDLRHKLMHDHQIKHVPAVKVVGVARTDLPWGVFKHMKRVMQPLPKMPKHKPSPIRWVAAAVGDRSEKQA
jgi:hypothetical protein